MPLTHEMPAGVLSTLPFPVLLTFKVYCNWLPLPLRVTKVGELGSFDGMVRVPPLSPEVDAVNVT